MRPKDELQTTITRAVYSSRLKQVLARRFEICSFCQWPARVHGTRRVKHGHRKPNKFKGEHRE